MYKYKKLSLALAIGCASSMAYGAGELYFSEYIEGTSNNKALEIYNGTGSLVDLSAYEVQIYFNGNTNPGFTLNLSGTVPDGDVFVLAHSRAVTEILDRADQTSGAVSFNGDDAIVLLNGGVAIDSIGQVGIDPGSEWGSEDTSTQNNTLRRLALSNGDNNPNDAFDPTIEWQGFPTNSFEDLGIAAGKGSDSGESESDLTSIIINEVDVDTAGTDTLEFVELFDGGVGNIDLDGLTLVFFNGNNDTSYAAYDLDGFSTNEAGYFVLGNEAVPNVSITFSTTGLQNGADAVALYEADASSFPNGTAVTASALIDAVVYDTNDADDSGLSILLDSGESQLNEGELGNQEAHSNQYCESGYIQALASPGIENSCTPVVVQACGEATTYIHEIQGSGFSSLLAGTQQTVEAVVVGDFQANGQLSGFYL